MIYFPNLSRPKHAAKILRNETGMVLSEAQRVVAVILGYRDWHHLHQCHASQPATPLDRDLSPEDAASRGTVLSWRLCSAGDIPLERAPALLASLRLLSGGEATPALLDRVIAKLGGDECPFVRANRDGLWRLCEIIKSNGNAGTIVIVGDAGTGKTILAKAITAALDQPLFMIDCGGVGAEKFPGMMRGDDRGEPGAMPGLMTAHLANHPQAVVIFDEAERLAHRAFVVLRNLMDDDIRDAYYPDHEIDTGRVLKIIVSIWDGSQLPSAILDGIGPDAVFRTAPLNLRRYYREMGDDMEALPILDMVNEFSPYAVSRAEARFPERLSGEK